MHRPTLLVGLVVILVMCLVPPFESGPLDQLTDRLQGERETQVDYQPIWSHPTLTSEGPRSFFQESDIAGNRLLVQILVVIAVTGGVALWLGPRRR